MGSALGSKGKPAGAAPGSGKSGDSALGTFGRERAAPQRKRAPGPDAAMQKQFMAEETLRLRPQSGSAPGSGENKLPQGGTIGRPAQQGTAARPAQQIGSALGLEKANSRKEGAAAEQPRSGREAAHQNKRKRAPGPDAAMQKQFMAEETLRLRPQSGSAPGPGNSKGSAPGPDKSGGSALGSKGKLAGSAPGPEENK